MVETDIPAILRTEFGLEAEAGFPRLGRIPQTKVIQFLDYYDSLGLSARADLLDALALRGATLVYVGQMAGPPRSCPPAPAFDRYWRAVTSPGPFFGGLRYCDVKLLASIPRMYRSYERWIEQELRPWVSEGALHPREDLLPDINCLVPAKAATLRKLLKGVLHTHGFVAKAQKEAEPTFIHDNGAILRADFGSYLG
jgi:hypothetical protein